MPGKQQPTKGLSITRGLLSPNTVWHWGGYKMSTCHLFLVFFVTFFCNDLTFSRPKGSKKGRLNGLFLFWPQILKNIGQFQRYFSSKYVFDKWKKTTWVCQHAIYFWSFLWGSFFCYIFCLALAFQGPLVTKKETLNGLFLFWWPILVFNTKF